MHSLDQQADGNKLPGPALTLHLRDEATAMLQVALTDYASPENAHYLYQLRGSPDSAWHPLVPLHTLRLHQDIFNCVSEASRLVASRQLLY